MGPENGGVDGSNRSGGDDGVGDGLVEWTEVVKLRKAAVGGGEGKERSKFEGI